MYITHRIALLIFCLLAQFTVQAQKQLWGMSRANGSVNGAIFKTDSTGNNYTDVYIFNSPLNGIEPYGSLMQAADGKLYGMTSGGGLYGYGVIFQLDPATGIYLKKHDFDSINGKRPLGTLCQASNGKLYGMTYAGGSATPWPDRGTLFEYDPATNVFLKKVDLIAQNSAYAYGSLIQGSDGALYGMTSVGGGDATGLLFKYDIGTATISHQASFIAGPAWQGYNPLGSLVQASDGRFYGFSQYGGPGASGGGVVFRFDPAGSFGNKMKTLHRFDEMPPADVNGHGLTGTPVLAANGKLYGMTNFGGFKNAGTIFEIDLATGIYQKRYDFDSTTEGFMPYGSLTLASSGKLYGLLTSENSQARVFQFDAVTNTVNVKANITGTPYYTALIETGPGKTSIRDLFFESSLRIYPNPASDILHIEVDESLRNADLQLTSSGDKTVLKQALQPTADVDVSDVSPGVYFIRLFSDGKLVAERPVVICR